MTQNMTGMNPWEHVTRGEQHILREQSMGQVINCKSNCSKWQRFVPNLGENCGCGREDGETTLVGGTTAPRSAGASSPLGRREWGEMEENGGREEQ